MKKCAILLLVLILALCASAQADLLDEVRSRGKLVIATEGAWSPWTFHDESDQLVGFDVDVARAIAEKLGVDAEFVECPWESIFLGIDSKMYDMASNCVAITEERSLKYDFTQPYAYLQTALIVRGDNDQIHSFDDLAGRRTANSIGSTYAMLGESYGAVIDNVSTLAQTLDLVLSGRADATLNAELSFYDYMKEHPDANLKIVALSPNPEKVGIPVRKGNEAFLSALNDAISALREDGTLKTISHRYFTPDITSLSGN